MAVFPLASMTVCWMHICKCVVAMRHAQNTAMTAPGEILPVLTSLAPNQNACTNIPMQTNWEAAWVPPQTMLSFRMVLLTRERTEDTAETSLDCALNAFTVEMAPMARSMSVAATAVCWRSAAWRGLAKLSEIPWMSMRAGTAERITSVKNGERMNASTRQVIVVVRYWMRFPVASDEAARTSSVSLFEEKKAMSLGVDWESESLTLQTSP
jgi:hypothetical protein